jgi:hypothetical protein
VRIVALLLYATSLFAGVERTVTPGGAGPNRLDADVALVAGAAEDLRDLRLYDAQQREIGYLLMPPASREPQWVDGRILPIASTKTTSGFEVDLHGSATVDRLRLQGIAAPFLKRVRVEGSGDRSRWTLLADSTVFDLPEERLQMLDVAFEAGAFRYLRVTWDDRSSARVTSVGSASARLHGPAAPAEPLRATLAFRKRASEPGKSRYRIHLPGPHLPLAAIEVRVANGNVFRTATITEPRLGNGEVLPATLGSGTLRRAERAGAVAEEMTITVERPIGRELDLAIDDGNNPPLALTAIVARFAAQPWIYFEAPAGTPLVARYGNERLAAPRYDLEAARKHLDLAHVASATWSEAPRDVASPVAATDTIASLQGAAVDRGAFRVARAIPAATPGLTVLLLDADVQARSRGLADVRIVTSNDAQVPYLVEMRDEPLVVPLTLQRVDGERGTSVYRLALPYTTLPQATRLVLETNARVFEREVTLRSAANERRGRLSSGLAHATWRAADPELLPPALTFDVPVRGIEALELVVAEGDNAPLPLAGAKLLLPSAALRFHHPGTRLFLLYGNTEAQEPRYDLSLLGPHLFGQPARELTLQPLKSPRTSDGPTLERKLFWGAIIAVAVVLLLLLARLLVPRVAPVSD